MDPITQCDLRGNILNSLRQLFLIQQVNDMGELRRVGKPDGFIRWLPARDGAASHVRQAVGDAMRPVASKV